MFDDYYSFNPRFHLEQHCFVVSFFGTPLPTGARFFHTLSGVPVVDVERVLEHELGSTLSHYERLHHREAIFQVELDLLQRVSNEQPSLIVLRPSTLRYRKSRDFLQRKSGIVVQQDPSVLMEQLNTIYTEDRRERYWDLDLPLPITEPQLLAEWVVWKRFLPLDWKQISIPKISPLELGQQLITECQAL